MATRIEKMYEYPVFQYMKGLPEEIVAFEAKTGTSLPDTFDYCFVQVMETNEMVMALGRIGDFYVIVMEIGERVTYELHENKASFKLWAAELTSTITSAHRGMDTNKEEKKNIEDNMRAFLEKVEKITKEEDE
ncbi:hypothetical protein CN918_26925 [Priestia megaterium]|nr:hypothetical protein CN918_26925 [Priestia megaterium]